MKPLLSALNDIPEYRSLLAAIDNGACPAAFSGLSAVHRAHFAAGIRQELNRPVVVVCADEGEAERMARDLEQPYKPFMFPVYRHIYFIRINMKSSYHYFFYKLFSQLSIMSFYFKSSNF